MATDSDEHSPITIEQVIGPQTETRQQTALGLCRKCNDLNALEQLFLGTALLGILGCLGLTIERLVTLEKNTADFIFALVLLVNAVFCVYYVLDGVYRERPYEVFTVVIGSAILIIYCAAEYGVDRSSKCRPWEGQCSPNDIVKMTRLILIGIIGPVIMALGCLVSWQYYKSGNLVFRTVGANIELQKMCRIVYLCETLLKFDLQLGVTMIILVLQSSEQADELSSLEITILSVGIAFNVLWMLLGFVGMWLESKYLSHIFLITSILEPAYIIYKIWDVSDQLSNKSGMVTVVPPTGNITTTLLPTLEPASPTAILQIAVYFIGLGALALRVVLVVTMVVVSRNYGKGLKEKVYGTPPALLVDHSQPPTAAGFHNYGSL